MMCIDPVHWLGHWLLPRRSLCLSLHSLSRDQVAEHIACFETAIQFGVEDFANLVFHLAIQLYWWGGGLFSRSEEHTSELQSRQYLVCRLLLEQKSPPSSPQLDRKSTRLNSSHANISYAVFCLNKTNRAPRTAPPGSAASFAQLRIEQALGEAVEHAHGRLALGAAHLQRDRVADQTSQRDARRG